MSRLTRADGTAIDDGAVYTVAAWAGSVDARYLSGEEKEFPEAGSCKELMTAAIQKAGTVAPARDGRITLVWT